MINSKYPYLIAEAGINHNGSITQAIRLIKQASKSKADAIKFQMFDADEFMSKNNLTYKYKVKGKFRKENMYKMFKRLEFKMEWIKKLLKECKKNKIDFLSSAADKKSVDLLCKCNVKAIKLSSEDIINYPLIEYVSKKKIFTILSTGMANEEEIKKAIYYFKKNKTKYMLLHCVSIYPTDWSNANLLRIKELKKKYKSDIGYSDHTLGIKACEIATALGAKVIEKHFTLNKNDNGPDHMISSDPKEFYEMSNSTKNIIKLLGSGQIAPGKTENLMKKVFRRSITAKKKILKDEILTVDNIGLKRPASGLHPKYMKKIIGKKIKCNKKKDQKINLKDIF